MLVREVGLYEYLGLQYPPVLWNGFPEQALADWYRERDAILAATLQTDTLWLWREVDWDDIVDGAPYDRGGLAVMRAGRVNEVWLVWEGY
ncbi:hypothetical protein FRUB_05539 [Fimbriiglobus ruber]|uniref:Uncharacterized protein n=2 Tax=Fimbriiglobus ruber TaxID=1908690 RepID=A0A225DGG0_9BACT|nr:hypothetical protein FRUB_05539 [Fimbriiglobus ruber]